MQTLESVILDVAGQPDGSVIWLHGLGADGHDFEAIVPELNLPDSLNLRFIFPHAPVRSVTLNNGMRMRAWYDILSLDRGGPQDDKGVCDSSELLGQLIENEREQGVPAEKIVLAGFSQGGAIAIHTALRYPQRLAGLMALSTYMPLQSRFQDDVVANDSSQARHLPVYMAHGSSDPVIPIALGKTSAGKIAEAGYQVEWHEYAMAHAVCAQEIADIRAWLLSIYQP